MESARRAGDEGELGARDRALLRLAFDLCLRRGELARLNLEQLDLAAATLAVQRKGLEGAGAAHAAPGDCRHAARLAGAAGPRSRLALRQLRPRREGPAADLDLDLPDRARLGDQVQVRARPHGLCNAAITAVLDLSHGDVRAAARFGRQTDIRPLTVYDDNRQDLGGKMACLVAASL